MAVDSEVGVELVLEEIYPLLHLRSSQSGLILIALEEWNNVFRKSKPPFDFQTYHIRESLTKVIWKGFEMLFRASMKTGEGCFGSFVELLL